MAPIDATKVLVIVPGSSHVRIGVATEEAPQYIPHVIAHQYDPQITNKEAFPFVDSVKTIEKETLTDVRRFLGLKEPSDITSTVGQDIYTKDNCFEDFTEEELEKDSKEWTFHDPTRRHYVGQEALNLHHSAPYYLRYPISEGYFAPIDNVNYHSKQEILQDMETIWTTIIQEKLDISPDKLKEYAVILTIPDIFAKDQVVDFVELCLYWIKFKSLVMFQESVCCSFGLYMPIACIVSVGDQHATVSCVQEGVIIPGSSVYIPFGGRDITTTLYSLLSSSSHYFPYPENKIATKAKDFQMFQRIKEECCSMMTLADKDKADVLTLQKPGCPKFGEIPRKLRMNITDELILASNALFFPQLLSISGKRKFAYIVAPALLWTTNGTGTSEKVDVGNIQHRDTTADNVIPGIKRQTNDFDQLYTNKEHQCSLADAVARSISRVSHGNLREALYAHIGLAGGSTMFPGFARTFQSRIAKVEGLSTSPRTLVNDNAQIDRRFISWHGAAMLRYTTSLESMFITLEDWETEGMLALQRRWTFSW